MLRGREFTAEDDEDAPVVALVNETMARKLWPGKDAIGGTVKMLNESSPWATVVGIVKDVRSAGHQSDVPPTMYFPHAQAGRSAYYTPATMNLVVQTDGDPLAAALYAGTGVGDVVSVEPAEELAARLMREAASLRSTS